MSKTFKKARLTKLKSPVFVTGAAGFIGRRLVNYLLEIDVEVVAFDIIACPEALAESSSLRWVKGDVTDYEEVYQAMSGVKTVFHLAAMVGDWGAAELHRRVTVDGTDNVFRAGQEGGENPTVVLASSIVVYGQQIGEGTCHEGCSLGNTFGPYSESKQAQEKLAQAYLQKGLDVRIVRPANVYGAGSKPWVEELCRELKRGVPALIGGGDFNAGLVHVDNVVDILVRAARASGQAGQVFNAGEEEVVTWKQYTGDLARLIGAPRPRSLPFFVASSMSLALEKSYRLFGVTSRPPLTQEALNLVGSAHDISMKKTVAVLGFRPLVSYREGLNEVQHYMHASAD
jgi:nucleoside-diphosphate-sugar epimerase